MKYAKYSLLFTLLSFQAFSQEKAPAVKKESNTVIRPDTAVLLANRDIEAVIQANPVEALYTRYIMDYEPSATTIAELSLAANFVFLQNSDPIRVTRVSDGLYKVLLADYVNHDEVKVRLLLDTWERMDDGMFYLSSDKTREVTSPRWFDKNSGKVWQRVAIRTLVPHAHANVDGQLDKLCKTTSSFIPIVSKGQYLRFLLNSEFGGLYPEFTQIDQKPEKGTAEDAFLSLAHIDLKTLGDSNSDQRVALTRKPTSQPGTIEYMPAAVTRVAKGPSIVTITRDFFTGPLRGNRHPIENLLDRKHDGSEIFVPTDAGGLRMGLFNGAGGFVRSAPLNPPQTLASDKTVPGEFPPILQIPSSCLRCHILNNPNTKLYGVYQYAPNYVTFLRNVHVNGVKFDVFGDNSEKNTDASKKRLAALFKGETSDAFTYAGRTFANFVFEASGLPLEEAMAAMLSSHDDWLYTYKQPTDILLSFGYVTETNEEAVTLFNKLCPPAPEPLRVTEIRAYKDKEQEILIPVDDLLLTYGEIALRMSVVEQQLKQPVDPVEKIKE